MKKRPDPEPISMVPMIDVVFQLMIFFIFIGSNDPTKLDKELELAKGPHGTKVEEFEPATVHIQVKKSGAILIGSALYDLGLLQQHMKAMVSQFGQGVPVVIHADSRTMHANVSRVMNTLAGIGLWKLSLTAAGE